LFILTIAHVEFKSIVFSVIPLVFVLALRSLLYKGFVSSISTLFLFLSWLNLTTAAILDGYGIRGTSLYGYALIVVVAGLLIGWRASVGFAILNLFSGLGLIYAGEEGMLPPRSVMQTDFTIWSANAVFSICAAFVIGITLRVLNDTFLSASIKETYYRMLFEEAPDGIMIVDRENRVVMANAAVYQLTGYSAEDILGRAPNEFVAPEDIARQPLRSFAEIQVPGIMKRERVIVCKDGSRLDVIVGSSYMPDGQLQYIIQDITARRQMERSLRASEEKFAKSFQSSPDAVTISSIVTGKFIDLNEGFCHMSGYTREEALGRSAEELHIWDNIENRKRMVELLQKDGRVRDFETILRRKSGEPVHCLLSAEVIEIAGERCMVIITRDVTDRKRMEQELRVSEERYRLVSSVISDYTFFPKVEEDDSLRMVWIGGAFEKITGYTTDEFNERGGWVATVHPGDVAPDAHDMEMLRNNERIVSEIRTVRKDGEICWVRVYAHPIWDTERNRLASTARFRISTRRNGSSRSAKT